MQNQTQAPIAFDKARASSYDKKFAAMAPMRDALQLLTRAILSELPADSRILCVGAGTGTEIIDLAQAFPKWQFTAVEPAAPMLNICRQRVEENGLTSRCTFHEGYLDSLPAVEPFDAATSLLVSQFIMQPEERRNFFRQIATRLRPDGILVCADLTSDMSTAAYQSLLEVWLRMLQACDIPTEEIKNMRASFGRSVAILPPQEVEAILASSSFEAPVLFLQTLLIHAWFAKRTS